VFVKVRSTRPPQAGWLSAAAGGYEVELIDGEHGVSPGQACVFYDAAGGQARVLGGGFIASAVSAAVNAARGRSEMIPAAVRS
jgi:tRNA-specific 2-thiouridylase